MPNRTLVSGHGYTVRVRMVFEDGSFVYDNINIPAKNLEEAYDVVNHDLIIRAEFFVRHPNAVNLYIDGGWVKPLRCKNHEWVWLYENFDECLTCGKQRPLTVIRKTLRNIRQALPENPLS